MEYGGEIFLAGELTADILNFTPEDYLPIQHLLDRMKNLAKQYEDALDRGIWWEPNNQFIELRSQLMWYRVFRILLQEDEQFLNETQQYTENASLFTDEEMDEQDCSTERLLEMHRQKEEGRTPPFLLIVAGNRNDKWRYYKLQMTRYRRYIEDIRISRRRCDPCGDYGVPARRAPAVFQEGAGHPWPVLRCVWPSQDGFAGDRCAKPDERVRRRESQGSGVEAFTGPVPG